MKTIGEIYREKILPRTDLVERDLPDPRNEEIRVVRDLFGWNIRAGKELIECRSEDEARYIAVFYATGMYTVSVPQDDEYLKSIVPKLERVKKRIDEIIAEESAGLRSPRLREGLKWEVYSRIIKQARETSAPAV